MHFPEPGGDSGAVTEIQRAHVNAALPEHGGAHQKKPDDHAARQPQRRSLSIPVQHGHQHQPPHHALGHPQRVARQIVVSVNPLGPQVRQHRGPGCGSTRIVQAAPHAYQQQRRQHHVNPLHAARRPSQRRRRLVPRIKPPAQVGAAHGSEYQEVRFVHQPPACPGCEIGHGQHGRQHEPQISRPPYGPGRYAPQNQHGKRRSHRVLQSSSQCGRRK